MALEKPSNQRKSILSLPTLWLIVSVGRKKKEANGQRPLLRPIICICNDLYASSLAKLRPLARIVRFSRPADLHMVKRLREICEEESLKAESRALTTLVGVCMGDFRGCLNTLQVPLRYNLSVAFFDRDANSFIIITAALESSESDRDGADSTQGHVRDERSRLLVQCCPQQSLRPYE